MKYLIEITHPHFVHFYKNIIKLLPSEKTIIACQNSGIILRLLDSLGFNYKIIGLKHYGITGKFYGQIKYFWEFCKIIKKENVDCFVGLSPSALLASKYCGIRNIYFDDDDLAVQPFTEYFTVPFADCVVTPSCLSHERYGKKHYTYRGYQELAYLSPNYFIPQKNIVEKYKIREPYIILRFNEFKAHHDIGHEGIKPQTKKKLVKLLKDKYQIVITSEGMLEKEFEQYRLDIDPIDIHNILYYAHMFIGDSQTMASEAAVLGTPSLRCNTFKDKIAYLNELEYCYSLAYSFLPNEEDMLLKKILSLINDNELKVKWAKRRDFMLQEKEDVNKKIVEIINSIVNK